MRSILYTLMALVLVAGSIVLVSAPGPSWTEHDRAFYASPSLVNFVRPGLVIKIVTADISADGTIRARVKLTDPKGLPLDRLGVTTPGAVSVSFIAANIPKGQTQYVAYTTRPQTSPITKVTADQAGGDSGGTFEQVADGEYIYTFKTKAPTGFDKTVTHTIGAYGSRALTEFDMGTQYDDDVYNFVPDGSKVTVVRDVVKTAACNQCHDQIAFHGGSRRSVELCVLCHTPQSIDPDTGNTVDMAVFIHKIHMGSGLPSVKAGKKYQIIGHNQTVADYSDVAFPADARNCDACHSPGGTQAANMYKPNRAACGSCHDQTNFQTGENHVDLPQMSDSQCANCHKQSGELEFDASIDGAHTIPRFSKTLQGVVFELMAVDNARPGASPLVTFTIKDKAGNPIPISTMARLNLVLAGPNTDYSFYVSENALTATGPGDGRYYWTFAKTLPDDPNASYTIGIEGRRDAKLLPGTKKEMTIREVGQNKVIYFSASGSKPQPRRTIVTTAKCNGCHNSLSLHGDNRNTVEQCVLCHSPNTLGGTQSVDFKVMIHRIHTGKELARPYVVGSANFNEVGYPGDRRNCGACHVNGSEQLPSPATLAVKDPAGPLNPMQPVTAACTGCHSSIAAASHALSNTTSIGEACATCHGPNSEYSINRVHAR